MKLLDEALGGLTGTEDIRPQMTTSHLQVGDRFECGPVVSVQQDFIQQPVRDVLLSDRPAHCIAEKLCEGSLAAPGQLDGSAKSNNVRFIHEHILYTNRFVRVNEPVCVTEQKGTCTVLQMRSTQRKTAIKPAKNKRIAVPGMDGKTLGQRVGEAMAYQTGRRGTGTEYTQKDLLEDVNKMAVMDNESGPLLSQAMASAIMRGKVTRSAFTPYIAKACNVDAVWLAHGVGQMIPKH